jgi:hypothetical protein
MAVGGCGALLTMGASSLVMLAVAVCTALLRK